MVISKKEEKAFPRGGKPVKKNRDTIPKLKAREKDLFTTDTSSAYKKKFKAGKKKAKDALKAHQDSGLKVKIAEQLTYDRLSQGFQVLARVSEIRDLELRLSLPGRLVASVPITQISPSYAAGLKKVAQGIKKAEEVGITPLSSMFRVGQLVACCILECEKDEDRTFYKVSATLYPSKVNNLKVMEKDALVFAAVESVEDHGYVMDIGRSNMKAFLPKKKAEKYTQEFLNGQEPTVGQVLATVVTKADGSVVVLSTEPGKLRGVKADETTISVHSMSPGMSFGVTIDEEEDIKDGLVLKFGDFSGYVHDSHHDDDYSVGTEITATVLYVVPTVNTIYMSLKQDHNFGCPVKDPFVTHKLGDCVDNAVVVQTSQKGIKVKLSEGHYGFVTARQLTEAKEVTRNVKQKYPVDSKHTVRIVQFDQLERTFVCSMQKTILNQSVLKADQLSLGDTVIATVKKFVPKGLVVQVGRNVDAFIPMLHLSDVPLKHPDKKFSPGDKLKCKVLRTDVQKKKLHLTHKSILVKDNFDIVADYGDEHVGQVTEGVVVSISSDGLLLQLFGDARGWVPKSKISLEPVEYPEKLFFVGQALKCQVVDVDGDKKRMTLSLIIGGKQKPIGSKQRAQGEAVKLGTIYEGVQVADVTSDGLAVEIDLQQGNKVKAFVPKMHLTDHATLADQLLKTYSQGDVIEKALCFEKDVVPILTLKPLLLKNSQEQAAKSFDDLHIGLSVPGVVCLIKSYGVFLRLPTWKFRKSALIPTRFLADFFVQDPQEFVQLHQTLFGMVVEKNEAEQKLTMSAKMKDLYTPGNTEQSVFLLDSLLKDIDRVRQHVHNNQQLVSHKVGDVVSGQVKHVTEFGLEADVEGVRGLVPKSSLDMVPSVGQHMNAVVVFIDYQHNCMELSPQEGLIKRVCHRPKKEPKEGQVVKANVVVKRSEYHFVTMCIKSPGHLAGHFIHVPARQHVNDQIGFSDLYTVGEVYSVVMKTADIGVLEKHEKATTAKKRTRNSSLTLDKKPLKELKKDVVKEVVAVEKKRIRLESDDNNDSDVKLEPKPDPGWDKDFNPWGSEPIFEKEVKQDDDEDKEDKEGEKKKKTHLSKKEKKELDRLENEQVAKTEQRVLDGEDAEPETVDEFDRLVLASPDSSLCWIKYVAFHMGKQQYDLARAVVKRALEKINFREEAERFNVYMAWLNLENAFGTEEDADKVYKEALQCNDEFKVYEKAAALYAQSGKMDKAEKTHKVMARKFNKELEVWTQLGLFYYKAGNLKEARFTLQRSLQNLKKNADVVAVSSKFAQFEFLHGEAERGKTIFENIVRDFPNRTDQWAVYVDMIIKSGQVEAARDLFERMIHLGLAPKKMKALFKKYWEFEQQDQQRADAVRKKALEYLEKRGIKVGDSDPMDKMEVC